MKTFSVLVALCVGNSPVNSPHKGQRRGALMLLLICTWKNGWVNNRVAGALRRHHTHYDVTVMEWTIERLLSIVLVFLDYKDKDMHIEILVPTCVASTILNIYHEFVLCYCNQDTLPILIRFMVSKVTTFYDREWKIWCQKNFSYTGRVSIILCEDVFLYTYRLKCKSEMNASCPILIVFVIPYVDASFLSRKMR